MSRKFLYVCVVVGFVLAGCSAPAFDPTGGLGATPTPTPTVTGEPKVMGKIALAQTGKRAYTGKSATEGYMVVAQSNATGDIFRGVTDVEGNFQITIPEAENGNTFVITILGPDGKAVGPVLFGTAGADGITGLKTQGDENLGTVQIPADPTHQAIVPGNDSALVGQSDPNSMTRLNAEGVPVGLATKGKGDQAALAQGDVVSSGKADADKDGLIDMLDADDNGNGKVDDFEGGGTAGPAPKMFHVNFFMNLKVQSEQAQVYYSGTESERNAAVAKDTVITLEVVTDPNSASTIKSVHGVETPGPAYLPTATVLSYDGGAPATWLSLGYAFTKETDRFEVFVCPGAVMNSGDTFTIEVEFEDGATEQYSRMINYVFKNIPKLLKYGPAGGTLVDFDVNDPNVNGSPSKPILFDGTKDLTLVFNPPPDETGAYLTDLRYDFQMFYFNESDGGQLNQDIDYDATWPAPKPEGMRPNSANYEVAIESMPPLVDNTYTITIPKEYFVDAIKTKSGGTKAVTSYKIDITANCPSGNCAIMLCFKKQ